MAVQQNRKTPSKRGMRRAHDALTVSTDSHSGERHLRHHVTKDGFYRGRLAVVRPRVAQQIDIEE